MHVAPRVGGKGLPPCFPNRRGSVIRNKAAGHLLGLGQLRNFLPSLEGFYFTSLESAMPPSYDDLLRNMLLGRSANARALPAVQDLGVLLKSPMLIPYPESSEMNPVLPRLMWSFLVKDGSTSDELRRVANGAVPGQQ